MPEINGLLESGLYVAELERARRFYETILGFTVMVADERFAAYSVAGRQVLLLFRKGGTREPISFEGGVIPPHDGEGTQHVAFAIAASEWTAWEEHLRRHQVAIESVVTWGGGGRSIFFRDPDHHLLELITPGCWPIY